MKRLQLANAEKRIDELEAMLRRSQDVLILAYKAFLANAKVLDNGSSYEIAHEANKEINSILIDIDKLLERNK